MPQSALIIDDDRRRARVAVEALNINLIKIAARRRQGGSRNAGARSPAGLAQPARDLTIVSRRKVHDGKLVHVPDTPLGYETAVRSLPRILSRLDLGDPRRQVAQILADTAERIDSVKGLDLLSNGSSGEISDGGATTRIKHVVRLRRIEAFANGWSIDGQTGRIARGVERRARAVKRRRGNVKDITAMRLVCAVCVDGHSLRSVLVSHGWAYNAKAAATLGDALLEILGDIAEGLGIGWSYSDERA